MEDEHKKETEDIPELESESDEDIKKEKKTRIGWIIFFVAMVLAITACIIVIEVLK
jgi:type IV secretory pathway component VirB8